MSDDIFTLDTNILFYSVDRDAGHRHEIAKSIVGRARLLPCNLTLQSISEFYAAATRNKLLPRHVAANIAANFIGLFPTVATSETAVRRALELASRGMVSYWDALLIATAGEHGCTAVLTEDLADGNVIFGVRVVNPFAGTELSPAAEALLADE